MLLRVDITFGVVLGALLIVAVTVAALAHLGRAREIAVAGSGPPSSSAWSPW